MRTTIASRGCVCIGVGQDVIFQRFFVIFHFHFLFGICLKHTPITSSFQHGFFIEYFVALTRSNYLRLVFVIVRVPNVSSRITKERTFAGESHSKANFWLLFVLCPWSGSTKHHMCLDRGASSNLFESVGTIHQYCHNGHLPISTNHLCSLSWIREGCVWCGTYLRWPLIAPAALSVNQGCVATGSTCCYAAVVLLSAWHIIALALHPERYCRLCVLEYRDLRIAWERESHLPWQPV